MFNQRKLPLFAAKVVLVAALVTACRMQAGDAETPDSNNVTAESDAGESDDEPPSTVEVTRVVIETQVVGATGTGSGADTPEPKSLVICVGDEPESLYPYSSPRLSAVANHVHQAIYESMVTNLTFGYQAKGIEKLPSLADGDAMIRGAQVKAGDKVYDVNEDIVALRDGVQVRTMDGEVVTFRGEPLILPQMVVRFTLKPLVWSDGMPVTADDSVFSFELAADPETPIPKVDVERTASYQALDEHTVEWTSIPGYLDRNYFLRIWAPYPRHYWSQYSVGELVKAEETTVRPLSDGPFVLDEWVEGDYISLSRNEYYYRAAEGLPRVDQVVIKFVTSSSQLMAQMLAGQCDIATHDGLSIQDGPNLIEAEQGGLLKSFFQIGTVFEHIDFGINPVEDYALQRPDWFEDVLVRRAFVMCADRQRMVDELLFGRSEVMPSFVPAVHPLYPEDAETWPYDVTRASELLDEAGFLDADGDGIREDPRSGKPFQVVLLSPEGNELTERAAQMFRQNLAECGVSVEVRPTDSEIYFADGPEGPLFGRRFDLAAFPWLIGTEPNCALYLSTRVPSADNGWNRNYNNETGFADERYDEACQRALKAMPGTPEYQTAHEEALRIWAQQVPIVPLFSRLKVAATLPRVRNFDLDPTEPSELWNLNEIDLAS